MTTVSPACPKCRGDHFELRVVRSEAVAASRCLECTADYLLLDSKDYWFDVIQKGYPRATRCSCGGKSFRMRIDYSVRKDGDVDYIEVHSICSACGKTRRQLSCGVDYAGTDQLLKKPLLPCKNPRVLYDLKDINLSITLEDMGRIVDHLAKLSDGFVSCVRNGDTWVHIRQDAAGVKATIEKRKYLFVYATPDGIEIPEDRVNTVRKEEAFWKRSEVIRIGSKSHVCVYRDRDGLPRVYYGGVPPTLSGHSEVGLSFDIGFSNEFVRRDSVVSKPERFRRVTASLLEMLQSEFVCWRGPQCFDNPDVNVRIFGDRFRKKVRVSGKR